MFCDTDVEVDFIERYVSARELVESACAEVCSEILWTHWSDVKSVPQEWSDLAIATNGGVHLMPTRSRVSAGTSLHQFLRDESAVWRQVPLDSDAAWDLLLRAFGAITPSFSTTVENWEGSGQIEWIEADNALGACCKRTFDGRVIVCAERPTTVATLALLAHELGHGLHETYSPGVLANTLSTETVAMAFERWVMAQLLDKQSDLNIARATHAWLRAREREFSGRYGMLHVFECDVAAKCNQSDQPLSTEVISALWMQHNRAFFGPSIYLPATFAWSWIDVRPLYIRPGTIGAYPAAWAASAQQCSPTVLSTALNHMPR